MQSNYNKDDNKGRAGVIEPDEQNPKGQRPTNAVDEARQMLDEIAGLSHDYRASRQPRPDLAHVLRTIALSPLLLIRAIIRLLFSPVRNADFRLAREMRQFLKHPGHFFWFNRVAPERAAEHFGTTSTDAMTHHARRYGAHTAMLILAVIVVVFGGFSGLATRLMSAYAELPSNSNMDKNSTIIEDGRDIYISAIAGNITTMPHRTEVIVIKDGETLRSIAANRGLSLETLLWANKLTDPDSELKGGQKLIVPPTTGMLHIANPGDTVGKVAERYGVDPKVILSYKFNNLDGADESTTVLKPLQEVMVPGGSMPQRDTIYLYAVRGGDSLKTVADKFGLKSQTLLDNNDLDNGLRVGQQIRILPVDGLLYTVKKGDTLDGIANYLRTSPENILNFRPNNVARNVPLVTGASLVVPGGSWPPPPPVEELIPAPVVPKPSNTAPAVPRQSNQPVVAPLPSHPVVVPNKTQTPIQKPSPVKPVAPGQAVQKAPPVAVATAPRAAVQIGTANSGSGVGTGSMTWPIHGLITTYFGQPIWYGIHMGLDISTACGTPTVAADSGTVILSRWDGGYGNSVVIDHGSGIKTRYGHFMSQAPVSVGQRVAKGQLIGYEGTTGASTGCHVHFEVLVNGAYTDPLRWLR